MPAITLTGWEKRIKAHLEKTQQHRSRSAIQRLAMKVSKRAAKMQRVDPDELIRYCLTYQDPTGEEAVREVMATSAA